MNNEKDSNKLVTIKEKIVTAVKENKKRTIAAALSLILGISVGTTKNISKEEHNNNIKTIAAISEQVNNVTMNIMSLKNISISLLQLKMN